MSSQLLNTLRAIDARVFRTLVNELAQKMRVLPPVKATPETLLAWLDHVIGNDPVKLATVSLIVITTLSRIGVRATVSMIADAFPKANR